MHIIIIAVALSILKRGVLGKYRRKAFIHRQLKCPANTHNILDQQYPDALRRFHSVGGDSGVMETEGAPHGLGARPTLMRVHVIRVRGLPSAAPLLSPGQFNAGPILS